MTVRYQTRVSHELTEALDLSLLPVGLRVVEVGPLDLTTGCHLVTLDDDDAPEDLDGRLVLPLLQVRPDRSVIIVGREIQS